MTYNWGRNPRLWCKLFCAGLKSYFFINWESAMQNLTSKSCLQWNISASGQQTNLKAANEIILDICWTHSTDKANISSYFTNPRSLYNFPIKCQVWSYLKTWNFSFENGRNRKRISAISNLEEHAYLIRCPLSAFLKLLTYSPTRYYIRLKRYYQLTSTGLRQRCRRPYSANNCIVFSVASWYST